MRSVYVISENDVVDESVLAAAAAAGCTEVAVGVPPALQPFYDGRPLPCVVDEPDAPTESPPVDPLDALQAQVDTLTTALAQATTLAQVRKAAQQAQAS